MQSHLRASERWGTIDWVAGTLANVVLRRKHTLPIMLAVYETGAMDTSDLIRRVRGHPESVISAIRALEGSGILTRARSCSGHREVEIRLTVRGIQLVETPIYRWQRLLRKWNLPAD